MRILTMKPVATILCLSLCAASPALAQNKSVNAPIEVSADSFIADMNAKSGTYSGNVLVKQGNINLRANTIRVSLSGGKPEKIYANGNVEVNSPSGKVTGDAGVYDIAPRLITLTGNVVMTQNKNVLRGNLLTYDVATGIGKFGGTAPAVAGQPAQTNGRVRGVFTPPPQSSPKPTP